MRKRIYRAVDVKTIDHATLGAKLAGGHVAVGVDIAKRKTYATFVDSQRRSVATVCWLQPFESRRFVALLVNLRGRGIELDVAMESSGTYGDALRHLLSEVDIAVVRVSSKRVSDAAEVFDGVPSIHDAKAAAIIARLRLDGACQPWPLPSTGDRALAAAIGGLERASQQLQRVLSQLEATLGRHFPEATHLLSLADATLIRLLSELASPQAMAADPERLVAACQRFSRGLLSDAKVDALLHAARTTIGLPMIDEEVRALKALAADAYRLYCEQRVAKRRVEELSADHAACRAMRPVVGAVTAAVLVNVVGDPARFHCARAYVKACGLNLRERSSGRKKGKLCITKRGPGRARRLLWLAALRLLQRDPVVAAYYAKKVDRDGGSRKLIAITAVMRKLALALWHVGRGAVFEPERLFDVERLTLPEQVRDHKNRRRVVFDNR